MDSKPKLKLENPTKVIFENDVGHCVENSLKQCHLVVIKPILNVSRKEGDNKYT